MESCGEVRVGGRWVRWRVVWVVVRSCQPSESCSFLAIAAASAASVLFRDECQLERGRAKGKSAAHYCLSPAAMKPVFGLNLSFGSRPSSSSRSRGAFLFGDADLSKYRFGGAIVKERSTTSASSNSQKNCR